MALPIGAPGANRQHDYGRPLAKCHYGTCAPYPQRPVRTPRGPRVVLRTAQRLRSPRSVPDSVDLRMRVEPRVPYGGCVQSPERDQDSSPTTVEPSTEEGPALRDAITAAERADADEAAANRARDNFLVMPVPEIHADETISPHLNEGELVHALRRHAILKAPGGDAALGYGGTLYLTSRRLLHLGQVVVSVRLTDIVESSLAGERLLLTLRDGEGLALELDHPRLLRAEMAALMRELRS